MLKRGATLLMVVGLALAAAGPVAAKGPVGACPSDRSGFFLVDKQEWWDNTVDGFTTEGIDVYEDGVTGNPNTGFTSEFDDFAAAFGLGDGYGLWYFVWYTQWEGIDKNGNDRVCMKDWPNTPGNPAYYFGGIDDNTSAS